MSRAPRLAGLLLAFTALAGGADAAPPLRVAAEEVLRQSVRITWVDESRLAASQYRLERSEAADAGAAPKWFDAGAYINTGRLGHIVDRGPAGEGLAPGSYRYRLQGRYAGAWGEWSAPAEITLPPQCAGGENPPGNEAYGSLPTVVIGDLDGDGRHTGADVWKALQRCSALGGCIVEALPVVYDDVAISLYGQRDNRSCQSWSTLVCEPMPPFPNGLVIQGHGSATVFRSPIWKTPYKPAPILEIWHAPGVRLRFRNFVLDGRKRWQPNPSDGVNDVNTWRHKGLGVTHFFGPDHGLRYPDGCIHNVTARDFLVAGIDLDHARNWRIEYNRVRDIGCYAGLTECPRLTIPDVSLPPAWGCSGYKSTGYGIEIGAHVEDTIVAYNDITRVTKYALGVKGDSTGTAPIERLTLRHNRIINVGPVGIFLAGPIDSVVEHNLVQGTHTYGCRNGNAWASWGIQTNGTLRNTQIRENSLRDLAGVGIGSNAAVDRLEIANNRLDNVCVERNRSVGSDQAAIHLGSGSSGSFVLSNDTVTANHCSMAISVGFGSDAQVEVEGGRYQTAENAHESLGALHVESGDAAKSPRVWLKDGVVLEYAGDDDRHGVIASGNGSVILRDDSLRVEGYDEDLTEIQQCFDRRCVRWRSGRIVECVEDPESPECR
jgi:hypothetical protein